MVEGLVSVSRHNLVTLLAPYITFILWCIVEDPTRLWNPLKTLCEDKPPYWVWNSPMFLTWGKDLEHLARLQLEGCVYGSQNGFH